MTIQAHRTPDNPFGQPGFEVKSPCGRVWFVPLEQVRRDYAAFLQQVDGLGHDAAMAKVAENEEFVPTWFCEQFDWRDVARLGQLVQDASAEAVARALDFVRDNSGCAPTEDYTAHGIAGF
jgi:hypothetical protein